MSQKKNAKLQIADVREGNSTDRRHVLIVESTEIRKAVTINSSIYTIGRHPNNSLVFASQQISRYHATILWLKSRETQECSYWILDGDVEGKRSLNGISINTKKCFLQQLRDGDSILIGNHIKLRYTCVTTATLTSLNADETLTSSNVDEVKREISDESEINYQENTIVCNFIDRQEYSESEDRSQKKTGRRGDEETGGRGEILSYNHPVP
jgi:pSer/pThr/pTyr-binding forkhead associated (FHA) protein